MPKFVLRSKSAPDYFLKSKNGKELVFTDEIEQAYDFTACNIENAQAYFAVNNTQLIHQLFEVHQVVEPKYVIRVVGTELYIESIFNYTQFTEELFYALDMPTEAGIKEILNRVKDKVKSKLEIVRL